MLLYSITIVLSQISYSLVVILELELSGVSEVQYKCYEMLWTLIIFIFFYFSDFILILFSFAFSFG